MFLCLHNPNSFFAMTLPIFEMQNLFAHIDLNANFDVHNCLKPEKQFSLFHFSSLGDKVFTIDHFNVHNRSEILKK